MHGARFAASIALSNMLVPLNSTMIVVALPQLARDLGADVDETFWIVNSYVIAMAAVQPIAGRIGDRYGRRNVMLAAVAAFGLSSLGAAVAQGIVDLMFFRLLQAIAGATVVPNGLGLIREMPGGRRGTDLGIVSAAAGVGASFGPLAGAVLAAIDWRLIFLVNVPACALAFVLAWRVVPARAPRPEARFDVVGAAWLGGLLLVASWALTRLDGGVDVVTATLLAMLVPSTLMFVRYEGRRADPALPPALFAVPAFAASCIAIAFQNLALYGLLLAIPMAITGATIQGGVAVTALAIGQVLFSPFGGRWADRIGPRIPSIVGSLVIAAGVAPIAFAAGDLPFELLLASLGVAGVGLAITFPSMRLASLEAVPERYAALASGVFSTTRYFGGMVGTVVAVPLAFDPTPDRLRLLFGVLVLAGVLAAVASLALQGEPAAVEPELLAEDVPA